MFIDNRVMTRKSSSITERHKDAEKKKNPDHFLKATFLEKAGAKGPKLVTCCFTKACGRRKYHIVTITVVAFEDHHDDVEKFWIVWLMRCHWKSSCSADLMPLE